ncbi:PREDICTED: uncharacterized protein LOC104535824, partial [Mesitornis unicolor]|uniref:uncharacterized protein LOC104535824 n=1 Tax=Mesitornis unicolor TaxID=54374 RepID=UPI000528D453
MRMWTAWCVAMYFFGARAKITQTSNLVLKENDKATLTCSQNDNHNYMSWYLQQPGKGLQLIYYSIGENQLQKGDIHQEYEAKRLNLADFYLYILSVKMNQSAVYFCASSLDTSLQIGRYEFNGWTVTWVRNWLDDHAQSVTVNGSMSKWKPVMSGFPQGSILGLIPFNTFINIIDSGIECTFIKFTNDTKLSSGADTLGGRDAFQRDFDKLQDGAPVNIIKFNKTKWKYD